MVAGVLISKGAAWAFGVGLVVCLIVYGVNFLKGDTESGPLWADEQKDTDDDTNKRLKKPPLSPTLRRGIE